MINHIKYKAGYKYQLVEPCALRVGLRGYCFSHDWFSLEDAILYVKAGYAFDGPSGPTLDTKDFMRGSLAHDVCYQAMREGLLPDHRRKYVDQMLVEICEQDGMPWWRRKYVYWGVRCGGNKAAHTSREILTAP